VHDDVQVQPLAFFDLIAGLSRGGFDVGGKGLLAQGFGHGIASSLCFAPL
jgi:hypothetical protein